MTLEYCTDHAIFADTPEPPPVPRGEAVTPVLLAWLQERAEGYYKEAFHAAAQLVASRALFGLAKYGQPLMTDDGRDAVHDAMQELGDLLQYVMSAKMQGKDTSSLKEVALVVYELLSE